MISMTGYGRAERVTKDYLLTVELKTVNNKILDLNLKSPRCFISLEDVVRKIVQSKIMRGRVDMFINFTDLKQNDNNFILDEGALVNYLKIAQTIQEKYGVKNDLTASTILRLNEVVKDLDNNESYDYLKDTLQETVAEACDKLNAMRSVEGEKLCCDMLNRVSTCEELVAKIKERAPLVVEEYKAKLKEKIEDALKEVAYDEARLLNEVAFFTDKANIDEELTRLTSHIAQFRKLSKENDCGKKLDFLMQEFNREANTICSKANDIEITQTALALKCEIEKIREQVQNIE